MLSGLSGVWSKLAPLPRFRSGKLLDTAVPITASCAGSAGPSVAAGLEMQWARAGTNYLRSRAAGILILIQCLVSQTNLQKLH